MLVSKPHERSPRGDDETGGPVRVMVADDSAVVRGLIIRMLGLDPAITVVDSVANGAIAVERLTRNRDIDVIILDIEMPVMDGLTALRKLLAVDPGIQILMASTLTQRNAEISIQALDSGAADYIPKPSSRELGGNQDFQRELLAKVKALGGVRRRRAQPAGAAAQPSTLGRTQRSVQAPAAPARPAALSLRAPGRLRPEVIAIGCSTGGPQALAALFKALSGTEIRQPIVITQHMPPTFTTILAEHLQRVSGRPCAEAKNGETLAPRQIYIAPGDYHLTLEPVAGGSRVRLTQDPPENFCRPSVDPMLRSLARCYGGRILAAILTGMGSDGLAGCRTLVEAGGTVIAQDAATSVVWGMPGAVASAGLCTTVDPLDRLAAKIAEFSKGSDR